MTDPLDSQIATLCGRVEALVPGCRAGVCIASADHTKLERSVFPNLPPTFQQAIKELPMGPPYIGCCTAAMPPDPVSVMPRKALMMPMTVPKRPMKGAVVPIVASPERPFFMSAVVTSVAG